MHPPRVNIPLAKENLHLVILENQDSAAISLCIQLLIETMIRSFFGKVNIFWKVRCEKGGDLCGRGDVRCEGAKGAKKGEIIATFVVKLTAKARRVRRKQFTLKGVEMFGEKA